jgi:hypothetical protein
MSAVDAGGREGEKESERGGGGGHAAASAVPGSS